MKDLVEPGKAHNGQNSGDSNKRCPKMFSIALALTFIALVAFAAFLVSDILSLESNSSHAGSFGALSVLNPLESGAAMKDMQDKAANHTDQGEDRKTVSIPKIESATTNSSFVSTDNAGTTSDHSALAKSQPSSKSITTNKSSKQAVVINSFSRSSDGDSHKSSKEKRYSSSKSSSRGTQGDTSLSNHAKENRSESSQFPDHKDLSNNLTVNLSASAPVINATEILSNNSSENPSNNSTINASINASINTDAPQQEPITSDELNRTGSNSHNNYESIFAGGSIDSDAIPSEETITDSYPSPSGSGSQIAPDDQSQSQLKSGKEKENKRISNRGKSAKSVKKPTPRARPARTRPARPARDRSRK